MQDIPSIKQRAIITGADGGMGHVITRQLAAAGYKVVMLCHSAEKGGRCRRQIIEETGNKNITLKTVELASLADVRRIAQEIVREGIPIDLLMNNAARICTAYELTDEGFEKTWAINYLAPYVLTRCLLPLLHPGSRIVNMASIAIHFGKITYPDVFRYGEKHGHFHRLKAYSNSKLALWWFTLALAEKLQGQGITVNAADPGVVSTNILSMHNPLIDTLCNYLFRPFIRPVEKGAQTALYLLRDISVQGVSGRLFANQKCVRLSRQLSSPSNYHKLWDETERICIQKHILQNGMASDIKERK